MLAAFKNATSDLTAVYLVPKRIVSSIQTDMEMSGWYWRDIISAAPGLHVFAYPCLLYNFDVNGLLIYCRTDLLTQVRMQSNVSMKQQWSPCQQISGNNGMKIWHYKIMVWVGLNWQLQGLRLQVLVLNVLGLVPDGAKKNSLWRVNPLLGSLLE